MIPEELAMTSTNNFSPEGGPHYRTKYSWNKNLIFAC